MASSIAQSAVIDPRAEIDHDVEIGPYCVIGSGVQIGRGTRLQNHVTLMGCVRLGRRNRISPGVVIGGEPQDFSYRGEETEVVIGDDNVLREAVTVHRGTAKETGVTSIGNHCYLMAGAHVAHDCRIGDRAVLSNGTMLGGHVHVHDDATLSGAVAVQPFTTVGEFSFVAGLSRVLHDVPPYMLVEGSPARPRCVNLVGLKRNRFPADVIRALSEAFRLLYRAKVGLDHAREILRKRKLLLPSVNHLLAFVQEQHEGRHGRGRERRKAA